MGDAESGQQACGDEAARHPGAENGITVVQQGVAEVGVVVAAKVLEQPLPVEAGGARLDIARVAGAHMRRHLAQGAATLDLRPVEHDRLILDLTTDDRLPQPLLQRRAGADLGACHAALLPMLVKGQQHAAGYVPRIRIDHGNAGLRSEEHTSELQSLMRISYAVFCLKNTNTNNTNNDKKPQL